MNGCDFFLTAENFCCVIKKSLFSITLQKILELFYNDFRWQNLWGITKCLSEQLRIFYVSATAPGQLEYFSCDCYSTTGGTGIGTRKNGLQNNGPRKMVPRKMVPRRNGPRKNGPRKISPKKIGPRKIGPRKNSPRKVGPRKNVLQKLFSVKRMLGNLNDFSFLSFDSTTHTKRYSTFTSRSYMCTKL